MKDSSSHSWAGAIKKLVAKYQLPPLDVWTAHMPSKQDLKSTISKCVTASLRKSASSMSSLSYFDTINADCNKLHINWKNVSNALDLQKVHVKAKILTQRYPLASSHTAGDRKSDSCPLCHEEPETVTHFILQCPKLQKERNSYLPRIMQIFHDYGEDINIENIKSCILDSNNMRKPGNNLSATDQYLLVRISRDMNFKLHTKRSIYLGQSQTISYNVKSAKKSIRNA